MSSDARPMGYAYGAPQVSASPVSMEELRNLEDAVGWSEQDVKWLQAAAKILIPQAEAMVDDWRARIASQPHLVASFLDPHGKPDEEYKAAVKRRFVKWVADVCLRPHDQDWLNYQEEIGLRHTPAKKNRTDGGHTPAVVPQRYLIGFSSVVITSVRGFLAVDSRPEEELIRMQEAWTRGVLLSIALWTRAYTTDGLW
jgi:Protoglobin